MSYITVENFKFGLDARRSELTSQSGTLVTLENAYVNNGGEIEKRKAFVRATLPYWTFDLVATPSGLVTFGKSNKHTITSASRTTNVARIVFLQNTNYYSPVSVTVAINEAVFASLNGTFTTLSGDVGYVNYTSVGANISSTSATGYAIVSGFKTFFNITAISSDPNGVPTITLGNAPTDFAQLSFVAGDKVTISGDTLHTAINATWTIASVSGNAIVLSGSIGLEDSWVPAADVLTPYSFYRPTISANAILYQELEHPAVTLGATWNDTTHSLVEIVDAKSFGGKTFVIAKFADGQTFVFYDGTYVPQFIYGRILSGLTNLQLTQRFETWLASFGTSGRTIVIENNDSGSNANRNFYELPWTLSVNYSLYGSIGSSANGGLVTGKVEDGHAAVDGTATALTFAVTKTANAAITTVYLPYPVAGDYFGYLVPVILTAPVDSNTYADSNAFAAALKTALDGALNRSQISILYAYQTTYAVGATVRIDASYKAAFTDNGVVVSVSGNNVTITYPFALKMPNGKKYHAVSVVPGATLNTEVTAGFTDPASAHGTKYAFGLQDTWAVGDLFSYLFHDIDGDFYYGGHSLAGYTPTFAMALRNKMYLASGSRLNVSGVDDATEWEQPEPLLAGFVDPQDYKGENVTLVSLGIYQGRLVTLGKNVLQIWGSTGGPLPEDINDWVLQQTFQNVGTFAKFSTDSLGELDVLCLHDSGFRSVRVRDSSNNGFIVDIGTPIDQLVQAKILQCTDDTGASTDKQKACAVVEPNVGQYWCFLYDTIYVLSYFPQSKIIAWATLKATYSAAGTQTAFTPQKFVVYNGQVFVRDANAIYAYGGVSKTTYDTAVATVQIPWLDCKTPGTRKQGNAVDVFLSGNWTISLNMDPAEPSGSWQSSYVNNVATPNVGSVIPYSANGTHFALKAVSAATAEAAVFSGFNFHYDLGEETK